MRELCAAISDSCMMILAGMTVASSSHDKSIRIWEKSEEVLVLEEEKEQQREKEFDAEIEQEENPVVCYCYFTIRDPLLLKNC